MILTKSAKNQLNALLVAHFITLGETVKQHITDSSWWITPKNDQNIVVSQRQLLSRATSIINLLGDIMQISSINGSNQNMQQSSVKTDWISKQYVKPSNAINEYSQKRKPSVHLDTGGHNFDRFIVSERKNDNPFLDWIVSKFNRRGLDWSSGNLRLVNIQGNSLLGSDLIVHDRSIEIPLKQWLYALNSILKSNVNYT